MMLGANRILVLLILFPAIVESVDNSSSISFEFESVNIEAPDLRRLDYYRSHAGTFHCDLVDFDVSKLVSLIERIERGDYDVSDTSIELHVFGERLGLFRGIHSEVAVKPDSRGPYSWGGRREGGEVDFVNFVIDRYKIATMYVGVGEVSYRTHISRWSGNYFLCKADSTRSPTRID